MPLDPKKTKNGVDLNEVDISKLVLVDKEGLLDELKTRLSAEIRKLNDEVRKTVQSVVDDAKDDIADIVSNITTPSHQPATPPNSSGSTSSTNTPPAATGGSDSGSTPPRPPTPPTPRQPRQTGIPQSNPQKDFDNQLKLQHATAQMVDKLTAVQKKKNTEATKAALRGNVYSDKGKKHAESVDEMADEFQSYSQKELEAAKKKLSDIQEYVRFDTVGNEQKVLTDATIKLQKSLEQESKQRGTLLGKMSNFMQKENINAVSILTAMTTNSPMVGMLSKLAMDAIRDRKEKKQKEKANQIKIGDIKDKLPRPDLQEEDNPNIEDDTLREHLSTKSADVRHSTLEKLHDNQQITDDQHGRFSAEFLPPNFQSLPEQVPVAPVTPVTPAQAQPVASPVPVAPVTPVTPAQAQPVASPVTPVTPVTPAQAQPVASPVPVTPVTPAQAQPVASPVPVAPTSQTVPPPFMGTSPGPLNPTPVAPVAAPLKEPAQVIDIADHRPERVENDPLAPSPESRRKSINAVQREYKHEPSNQDLLDQYNEQDAKNKQEELQNKLVEAQIKYDSLSKEAPTPTSTTGKTPTQPPKELDWKNTPEFRDFDPFKPDEVGERDKAEKELIAIRTELERIEKTLKEYAAKNTIRNNMRDYGTRNGNNVVPFPTREEAPAEPERMAAHSTVVPTEDDETSLRPERVPTEKVVSIFGRMGKAAEGKGKAEASPSIPPDTNKPEMLVELGPKTITHLERLNSGTLDELKAINKALQKQIEQADLAADAARREGGGSERSSMLDQPTINAKKKEKGAGGGFISSILGGLFEGGLQGVGQRLLGNFMGGGKTGGLGKKFLRMGPLKGLRLPGRMRLAKMRGFKALNPFTWTKGLFGGAKVASKVAGGVGAAGAAATGAEALGGVAGGVKAAATGAEALGGVAGATGGMKAAVGGAEALGGAAGAAGGLAKEGGMISKMFGGLGKLTKLGGIAGKLGGLTKAIPVIGWVLTGIMAILDFVPAFINAEKFLGNNKKLTVLDRTAAGLGGVIKGIVGIVDLLFGLFGIKTDLGGILGKASAKMFAGVFKALGAIFKVIYEIVKPVMQVLGVILEFAGNRIGKLFEIIGEFFEFFGTFVEGIVDVISSVFEGDPVKMTDKLMGGLSKIFDGMWGMIKSIGKYIAHMFGLDMLKDAYDNLKESITDAIDGVGDYIRDMLGVDAIKKELGAIIDKIINVIKSPFKWLMRKLGIGGGDDDVKKKKEEPTTILGKVGGAISSGWNKLTGGDEETSGESHTSETRTGAYKDSKTGQERRDPSAAERLRNMLSGTSKALFSPTEEPSPSSERVGGTGVGNRNGGGKTAPLKLNEEQKSNSDIIRSALEATGMNPRQVAAVLGNVGKESGFTTKEENLNYGNTSNDRIRQVFGKERTNMSDDQLNKTKDDPAKFGESMYGKDTKVGKGMGNDKEGDGFKFRGRGFIQLTGKSNYAKASQEIYGDDRLVKDPDLVSKLDVAAKVTAWYADKNGKQMAQKMGIDLQNDSQKDVNLAYTSAVAGKAIKPGEGYLGGEVLDKVNTYASQFSKPTQAGGDSPVQMASAKQKEQSGWVNPIQALQQKLWPEESKQVTAGFNLLSASREGSALQRGLQAILPQQAPSMISQNQITKGGDSYKIDPQAHNTESTYQRLMNSQFVST